MSICAIALICSVVSLGLPYWAVYEYEALGVTINYGLFQVCSDDRQSDCELTGKTIQNVFVCFLMHIGGMYYCFVTLFV